VPWGGDPWPWAIGDPWVVDCGLQPHFCRVAATEFSRGFQPTDRGFTHDGFQPTDRRAPQFGFRRVATGECKAWASRPRGHWASHNPWVEPTAKFNRRYATRADAVRFPTRWGQPGDVVGWSRNDSTVADATGGLRGCPNPWVEIHGKIHPSLRDDGRRRIPVPWGGDPWPWAIGDPWVVDCGLQPHFCRVAATEFSRGFQPTDRGFTHDGFQPTDRVAPQLVPVASATDECHPSGIHAGGTPALPGLRARCPRSQVMPAFTRSNAAPHSSGTPAPPATAPSPPPAATSRQ